MKKIVRYSLVLCCIIVMGLFGNMSYSRSTEPVFHCNGVLSEKVKAVFNDLGVSFDTLAQANEFAQKNLLRSGERWDIQEDNALHRLMREKQSILIDDVRALRMVDAIKPTQKNYTYALLMGALKMRVTQRLEYLVELINSGHVFKYIVLLGGERQLRDVEKEGLPETVTTEAQMMEYVCAHYLEHTGQQIIVVNAPLIQKADGTLTRPTFE